MDEKLAIIEQTLTTLVKTMEQMDQRLTRLEANAQLNPKEKVRKSQEQD
jgi:hypothetical protein